MSRDSDAQPEAAQAGTAWEVFAAFLLLGLTAFGGPIAHLGYFREAFVERRGWVGEAAYAELVALCQMLPGPASSQVGFAIGLIRAGPAGALAAWLGFSLPSAMLMTALAFLPVSAGGAVGMAAIHGLKLVALVVVAQAVWSMARSLTPDFQRRAVAVAAVAIMVASPAAMGQVVAILLGGGAGVLFCRAGVAATGPGLPVLMSRRAGWLCLAAFAGILGAVGWINGGAGTRALDLFGIFYRVGAMVFGGGHVVLPLLHGQLVPGMISDQAFLAAYGVAQALPGPLFAISAYLGAAAEHGLWGAMVALGAIFLPGLLLVAGVLPFWATLRGVTAVRGALVGINAAVVGVLAQALYDPLWVGSIGSWRDGVMAAVAMLGLVKGKWPPLAVAVALVLVSVMMA